MINYGLKDIDDAIDRDDCIKPAVGRLNMGQEVLKKLRTIRY
jgi:hypothetical protein